VAAIGIFFAVKYPIFVLSGWTLLIFSVELLVIIISLQIAARRWASQDISVKEGITWSWSKAKEGLAGGLIGGAIGLGIVALIFLIGALLFGYNPIRVLGNSSDVWSGLWIFGPLVLLLPIFFGVSREEVQLRLHPGEGILRSLRNALLLGVVVSLFLYVSYIVTLFVVYGPPSGWAGLLSISQILLPLSLGAGVLTALYFGGSSCIRHFILRVVLWRYRRIPWNYSAFLNYANDRVLLRRVGGGYVFVHKLLLDYFADMNGSSTMIVAPSEHANQGTER